MSPTTAGDAEVGRTCPYCRFSFKGGVTVTECPSCRAVHHSECWEENTGCAVMGCKSAPAATRAQPAAPPPPPPPGMTPPAPPASPAAVPGQPRAPSTLAAAPSAAEVIAGAKAWLNTPMAAAAGIAGAAAAAIVLVFALALAIVTPDSSILGAGGSSLFKETMRLAVGTTMTRFGDGFGFTFLPLLFVAVPIAATAFGAFRASSRTAHLPVAARLLAGAACAIPFAGLMLVAGALGGDEGFSVGARSAIVLSLLWGAVGGVLGAARAIGPGSLQALMARVPPRGVRYAGLARLAVRPLAILLVLTGVIGIVAWTVQVARGEMQDGRSTAQSLVENPFFAAEFAVGIASLGSMAKAQPVGGEGAAVRVTPLPFDEHGEFHFSEPWRIFAFSDNWPPITFVLMLILAIGLPIVLAGYAGYAVATAAGASTPALGAARGAMVGVVWAIALTLVRWIGNMDFLAGDSVFVGVLLTAGAAGAAGGLLATRATAGAPAAGPPPLSEEPAVM